MAKEIRYGIKNVKGMSLIAVLWMVAILTVLASEFMYSLQLEVKTSRNWNDQVNAYYAAKGGFETAIANLRVDETSYDSLDEDWTKGFTGELNNSIFETNVIDESSRINVNTIDEATLTNVIQYCMTSIPANQDLAEAELTMKAQELAFAIIAKRPYRTTAEMAKVEGMTPDILYGYTEDSQNNTNSSSTNTAENTDTNGEQKIISLVDVITVFSVDKNVSNDGQKRININSADANTIQQGVNPQAQGQGQQQQQVITQQEAQAIVDYRSQSNSGQGGQGGQTNQGGQGGQTNQDGTGGQTGTQGQTQGGTQNTYNTITDLLNVPAISQATLDTIRPNIDVQDPPQQQGGQQGSSDQKMNINTASADQLSSRNLSGIDSGIAESIVNYRENTQQNKKFNSVDDLLQVKAVSIQDLKTIADKVTTTDDDILKGKVNINTIPLEILQRLPGMDETKANAIITYRETGTDLATGTNTTIQSGNQQQGGPFDNVGQLLDIQGIDENTFRQLVDLITYRTHAFRIESTGKSQDEKIVSSFTAIVDRSGTSVKIKFWKQG